MKLVVDANVLLAALIRKATTRELLLDSRLQLYGPEALASEALRHVQEDEEIRKKTKLSVADLTAVFELLSSRIAIVCKEDYAENLEAALDAAPHEEDAPYIALALSLKCPVWSNDVRLSGQTTVTVVTTSELIERLGCSGQ